MDWKKLVVDISCKRIWDPFLFAVLAGEVKLLYWMTVESSMLFRDQRIMPVYSYRLIVCEMEKVRILRLSWS